MFESFFSPREMTDRVQHCYQFFLFHLVFQFLVMIFFGDAAWSEQACVACSGMGATHITVSVVIVVGRPAFLFCSLL